MMTMFAALFCGCGNRQNKSAVNIVGVNEFAEIMRQKDVRLIDVRTIRPAALMWGTMPKDTLPVRRIST